MGKFVGVAVVLFVLAVGFVILTQGSEMSGVVAAFRSEPAADKIAWAVIVLVPLVMLPFSVWLWDRLARQREAAVELERRLDGVRARVKDAAKGQLDSDTEVQHLARTDPEDAIAALQRRIVESERFVQIQQGRNAMVDLDSRVDAIRSQQQALKDRLTPVLDTRRSIEQLFAELDSRQSDIEHALAEIASGDDGTTLELRLKNLTEFVRLSNFRCDQIEHASKTIADLKEACAEMRARLTPFSAAEDGITSRVRQLGDERERLTAAIASLERMPEGPLSERVEKFTEDRKKLDGDIAHLNDQFYKLGGLRKDVAALFTALERALNALSIARSDHGANDLDARVDDVSRFIEQTQNRFDDIERRVMVFGQLKTSLGELQSRLEPLESEDTGVIKLIGELQDIRERLIVKIRGIEGGGAGDLAARVHDFAEVKRELEERVSNLSDQFTKLSSIRRDIAGLFDKLSSAVSSSSTTS
jgi:predicted  nucleic acid-binding Zn-ribbon protein